MTHIAFDNGAGHTLAGRLTHPDGPTTATAVLAHCFTCGKDLPGAHRVAAALARRGFLVLRFDFTGLGASEGAFDQTTFTSNVDDLCAASAWLEAGHEAPSLLVGHSLGGLAALCAATRLPSVRAVATIGAPSAPAHITRHFDDPGTGDVRAKLGPRTITIGRDFIDDVKRTDLDAVLPALGCALLVLHSPQDTIVGVDNAARLFGAARHPKSFVSLDDADHLLTKRADADYAGEVIAAWSSRYSRLSGRS